MIGSSRFPRFVSLIATLVSLTAVYGKADQAGFVGRDSGGSPCPQFEITRLEMDAVLNSFPPMFNSRLKSLELKSTSPTESIYELVTSFAGQSSKFTIKVRGGNTCMPAQVQVVEKTETSLTPASTGQEQASEHRHCAYESPACAFKGGGATCYFTCTRPEDQKLIRASCPGKVPTGEPFYDGNRAINLLPELRDCIRMAIVRDRVMDLDWALGR
jgi:hypothetical protein